MRYPQEGSLWRHEKTGHHYVVLGCCRIEATDEPGVRYKRTLLPMNPERKERAHWIRPLAEFMDGRFTEITELPLVGRDQGLIDSLRETIARLHTEQVEAVFRMNVLERQRNTLREDRNALIEKYKRLEKRLQEARKRESDLATHVDELRAQLRPFG